MNYGQDRVMIMCRLGDAPVLAEVLIEARGRSGEASLHASTEMEAKRASSAVAIIDDVLKQLERPVPSADLPNRPVVLVIRDPDYQNQFVVDGEVDTIEVDLGRGFDGPSAFASLRLDQQEDWTRSVLANVAHLPAGSNVRQAAEQLVAELAS
jgi:hypothetical protein